MWGLEWCGIPTVGFVMSEVPSVEAALLLMMGGLGMPVIDIMCQGEKGKSRGLSRSVTLLS